MSMDITALWDALGWSILHSLWQGALIGFAVWVVRSLVTERRAWLRYLAGMTGLVMTFAAFMTTFVILMADRVASSAGSAPTLIQTDGTADLTLTFNVLPSAASQGTMPETIVPWLGMVWAIGFACLSLQAYRAWAETRRLATTGLSSPDLDWTDRFAQLIQKSGASHRIRFFVSEYVSGPMTLGALRPIVLVPVGFLTSMPANQVEAILLHELAHIRRHDFLMGLIQTAIRTVLYFNPAVIMISRQIDEDREQACDDMAVAVTGEPADLVRGLAALRLGPQQAKQDLVMAADGGPLLVRLNRLMGRPGGQQTSHKLSAAAISALLLGTAACSTVSLAHPAPPAPLAPPASEAKLELPDTVVRAEAPTPPKTVTPPKPPSLSIEMDGLEGDVVIETGVPNEFIVKTAELAELPPMPEMPEMPEMPPMPVMPPMPPAPAIPVPIFGDYDSEDDFEKAMEKWSAKMEAWGDKIDATFDEEWEAEMERWGEEVEARFEGDWEVKMEAWGREMEVWGEAVEVIAEQAGMEALSELKDIDVEAIRKQALKDAEKHLRWTEKHAEKEAARVEREVKREVERAMAEVERQQAKVERELERQERKRMQQERMAAVDASVKASEAWAKADKERVKAEAQYQKAVREDRGETVMTFNGVKDSPKVKMNGKSVDVGALHKNLMKQLRSDGLVNKNNQSVWLDICETDMSVDDRALTDSQSERYRKLLSKAGFDMTQSIGLHLKPDSMTIKLSSKESKTSYHYDSGEKAGSSSNK